MQAVSACGDRFCRHVFEISSSLCPPSADILVSVVVSNAFGNRIPSETHLISKQLMKRNY